VHKTENFCAALQKEMQRDASRWSNLKLSAGPLHGDLRFSPCRDSLRGDKRFDKIVAAAKAASR
jgi:hypothetical protein